MDADLSAARLERFVAALSVVLAFSIVASVVSAQTYRTPRVIHTSRIHAPEGTSASDFAPPPTVFDLVAARDELATRLGRAVAAAHVAAPPAPWNRWGLARTPISLRGMELDSARNQYFVPLDGGGRAWLTLDPGMQQTARRLVGRTADAGEALVAIDPATGRVLALAEDGEDAALARNLARSSWPWAASVFKVITGAAFLRHGIASRDTVTCYDGGRQSVELAQLTPRDGEGTCRTLVEAMAHSSNLVFARIADRHLSRAQLREMAEDFGFNTRIPFEMELDRSTINVPSDRLEYARLAAGFRHSRLTPMHAAVIFATIANDGVMMVPTIVASIEDASGRETYVHEPLVWRRVLGPANNAHLVELLATTAQTGTAASEYARRAGWPAAIRVWGKTGTLSQQRPSGQGTYLLRWFGGFARRDDRTVAFAALTACSDLWHQTGSMLSAEFVLATLR